jgi:type VI secretion system secreted protein Hcp
MALIDIFLKLDGIEGESQDNKHRHEIELVEWGWAVQQAGNLGIGQSQLSVPRTKGAKALFQDLSFKHRVDKASPKLILACAQGTAIPNATLTLRKAGGKAVEFLTLKLTDVTVSSVTLDATNADIPLEAVALHYGQISIQYAPQKADGSLDTPVEATCTVN